MKKVSIIVPVYNVEKYLKRCLDSLVNQTLKDIEIICINDGSTDGSLAILDEYVRNDDRIVVINQENSGLSVARNNGIGVAKGEYLGFVDSDDWVSEDYFEKLYNSAIQNNAEIAVGGIIRLHRFNRRKFLTFDKEIVTSDINLKFELCDMPEKSYVWNKIYKSSKLKEIGLKFEEGIVFEDCIFTPQALFYFDKMVTVPDAYYFYWRRSDSIVKQKDEKTLANMAYAHDKAQKFIEEHNIDISSHKPDCYRLKIFGLTVFKIRKKGPRKQYILFNIIKFGKL